MAKVKKNPAFLHPIDTVVHWYEEAQGIPAQIKKSFEEDKKKTVQLIEKLSADLKSAKVLRAKARELKVAATQRDRERSTAASHTQAKRRQSKYDAALRKVEKIDQKIQEAKVKLSHAKLKQKYYGALEKAFHSVTQLFTKKHRRSLKK